eukprot:5061505-Karenia_brevis.AAC.1
MSTERFAKATQILDRIKRLPHSRQHKMTFALTCANSQALYGCEARRPIDVHSRSLTFGLSRGPLELDPYVAIFLHRITMLRRTVTKFPHVWDCFARAAQLYHHHDFPGLFHEDLDLAMLSPAPPPGSEGRAAWKANIVPKGPVGLLLQHVHFLGAALDTTNMTIRSHRAAPLPFFATPYQLLKPTIT